MRSVALSSKNIQKHKWFDPQLQKTCENIMVLISIFKKHMKT